MESEGFLLIKNQCCQLLQKSDEFVGRIFVHCTKSDIQSEIFIYQKRLATLTESCSAENFLLSFIVLRNCLSTMCHMQYYLEWRVRTDRRSTSFKKRTRTILSFFSCSFRSVSCVKAEKTFQYGLFNHLHFCNTKQFHRLWVYILVSLLLENLRASKIINRKTDFGKSFFLLKTLQNCWFDEIFFFRWE